MTTTTSENYCHLPVDRIVASPYQYRKTFGGVEDNELADSVRVHGVLQPIRVRPNGKPGMFELVFGERRWRAAKQAELADVPAIVVDLTDDQVIEQLLVENLKRRDVHPIEEGEGYHKLMHEHGYSEAQLVAKTGKSKAYLYGRMKLARNLAPGPRKAVLEGKLPITHGELISRIGDPKLQEQCLLEVLGQKLDSNRTGELEDIGIAHERMSDDGKSVYAGTTQPLSFDATRALIKRRYSTKLALAKFDPTDATLTKAGACTSCQHRSGNQPELPGMDAKKSEDVCTKTPCFEEKTEAVWKRTAADARLRGIEIVEGKDAEKCFGFDGVQIGRSSPYVELEAQLPEDLQKTPNGKATWKGLLGSLAGEVPRALVKDETGAPRELLDKAAAVKLLREHKKLDKPPAKKAATSSSSTASWEERQAKDTEKRELNLAAASRVLDDVIKGIAEDPGKKEMAIWRLIARKVLDNAYEFTLMTERRDLKGAGALLALVDKAKTVDDIRMLLAEACACHFADAAARTYASKDDREEFAEVCKLFGGDLSKALELAKAAAKAEKQAAAAKKEKKAPKKKAGAK